MTRAELQREVERVGNEVYALREKFNADHSPFLAGLVRGAEESLVVARNALADPNVREEEL